MLSLDHFRLPLDERWLRRLEDGSIAAATTLRLREKRRLRRRCGFGARMFGLPALQSNTEGTAQVDLQIAGSWAARNHGTTSGFTGPQVTGTAKLRNVRIAVRGVGGPVEIASAEMQLLPDRVRVGKLSARRLKPLDGFAGDAARLRNPRGVPGALRPERESDCARRAPVSGLVRAPQATVVSRIGIDYAGGNIVPDEPASIRASDHRPPASTEAGGHASIREGEP